MNFPASKVTESAGRLEYYQALSRCILGHTQNFPFAGTPGVFESKELARLSVPDKDAQAWHVTLGAPQPATFTTAGQLLPAPPWYVGPDIGWTKARINWGRSGANHSMICDWRSGSTLQVFGSFVQVEAIVDRGTPTTDLNLAATISPGRNGAPSQPTMTLLIGSVAAGGTILDTPIPAFAKTVYPHVLTASAAINAGTAVLSFQNAPFSALSQVEFDFTDTQEPLEIPQPSSLVTYDNNSAVDHIIVSLQYQLFT